MTDPQFEQQLLEGIAERTGMKLVPVHGLKVDRMIIDYNPGRFISELAGPYRLSTEQHLMETFELRLLIQYTVHSDSPRTVYVQFLVMDCEGDFLSESAHPLNTKPTNFRI